MKKPKGLYVLIRGVPQGAKGFNALGELPERVKKLYERAIKHRKAVSVMVSADKRSFDQVRVIETSILLNLLLDDARDFYLATPNCQDERALIQICAYAELFYDHLEQATRMMIKYSETRLNATDSGQLTRDTNHLMKLIRTWRYERLWLDTSMSPTDLFLETEDQ